MDFDTLARKLRDRFPDLDAIYVFGSRAGSQHRPDSDLDLAVLSSAPLPAVALWEAAGDMAVLAGCTVDLVDLRQASTVLQYQVITSGRRLWATGSAADFFETRVLGDMTALNEARAPLIADILQRGTVHAR